MDELKCNIKRNKRPNISINSSLRLYVPPKVLADIQWPHSKTGLSWLFSALCTHLIPFALFFVLFFLSFLLVPFLQATFLSPSTIGPHQFCYLPTWRKGGVGATMGASLSKGAFGWGRVCVCGGACLLATRVSRSVRLSVCEAAIRFQDFPSVTGLLGNRAHRSALETTEPPHPHHPRPPPTPLPPCTGSLTLLASRGQQGPHLKTRALKILI